MCDHNCINCKHYPCTRCTVWKEPTSSTALPVFILPSISNNSNKDNIKLNNAMKKDRDYWKEKYEKMEQLLKKDSGCLYCIDINNQHSRCSKCTNKEQWFFDTRLLEEL